MKCLNCGTNHSEDDYTYCLNCGRPLGTPVPSQGGAIVQHRRQPTVWERWSRLPPPSRAATAMLPFLLLTQAFSTGMPWGVGWVLTMPVQISLFVVQGVLVEKFAKTDQNCSAHPFPELAIASAVKSILFALAIAVIVGLAETVLTFGGRLLFLPGDLTTGLATIVFCILFTCLGSGLFRVMGGRNLVIASIAASVISIAAVTGIIFIFFSKVLSLIFH
jgi:hypothetical protein